jgi:hypothetical protein
MLNVELKNLKSGYQNPKEIINSNIKTKRKEDFSQSRKTAKPQRKIRFLATKSTKQHDEKKRVIRRIHREHGERMEI